MKYLFTFLAVIFSIKTFAQANDAPCGAVNLTVTESSDPCIATSPNINVSAITYTPLTFYNCNATNTNPDIWFKFTTPNNANGNSASIYYYSSYWDNTNLANITVYEVTGCGGPYYARDCWSIDNNLAAGTTAHVVNYLTPGSEYYIRVSRGAMDVGNPFIKLCVTSGKPPLSAKIGINTNIPTVNFDVAGTVQLRDNVGIGTNAPQTKLHVIGATTTTGDLTVGGMVIIGNTYYSAKINDGSANFYAATGDKLTMDWRYNGLKTGIGYYANPLVRGSNLLFYTSFSEDNFIFGRGDPFYSSGAYFSEWMRLTGDGKLGIGTQTVDAKLHVAGTIKIVDGSQGANKVLTSDANGLANWQALPVAPTGVWATSGTNIYNSNTGNVGIGTSTPGFPLNFANTLGDKISLYGQSGNIYGLGIQGGLLQIHTSAVGEDIIFGYGASASMTEKVRIKGNGNVGIGNNNPIKPLSFPASLGEKILLYPGASGEVGIGVYGNELRLHCDNPGSKVSFGTQTNAGVFTELGKFEQNGAYAMSVFGSIWANGTTYTSDARYKMEIETLPNALQNLLQLRGTSYFYNTKQFPKNHFAETKQLGVIAQEVEKIYPELVSTAPDGYKTVNYIGLIPVMIESIKDLKKELDELKKAVNLIKGSLSDN